MVLTVLINLIEAILELKRSVGEEALLEFALDIRSESMNDLTGAAQGKGDGKEYLPVVVFLYIICAGILAHLIPNQIDCKFCQKKDDCKQCVQDYSLWVWLAWHAANDARFMADALHHEEISKILTARSNKLKYTLDYMNNVK